MIQDASFWIPDARCRICLGAARDSIWRAFQMLTSLKHKDPSFENDLLLHSGKNKRLVQDNKPLSSSHVPTAVSKTRVDKMDEQNGPSNLSLFQAEQNAD